MTKEEIETKLTEWNIGESKVFKTYNYFVLDYLVIKKINNKLFDCDKELSTSYRGRFNFDEIVSYIQMGVFHESNEYAGQNFKRVRSQGCTCGGYATSNPDCHSFNCIRYKK